VFSLLRCNRPREGDLRRGRVLPFAFACSLLSCGASCTGEALRVRFVATAVAWTGRESMEERLPYGSQGIAAVGLDEFEAMQEA
jgi:hypothetical protein